MKRFEIIVFTWPGHTENEAHKITRLLNCGCDYVHIRKPGLSREEISDLIDSIPDELHCRLSIHDHFGLCAKYDSLAVHLNSRNPVAPEGVCGISRSCHSLSELADADRYRYVTLSPVYDSISKHGYRAAFTPDELRTGLNVGNVIALGGVTPSKFAELKQTGFAGAALLGYVWEGDFNSKLRKLLDAAELVNGAVRASDIF